MVKTKLLFLFVLMLVFVWINVPCANSYSEVPVEISNDLSVPLEKVVEFHLELPGFKSSDRISILDNGFNAPVEVVEVDGNEVTFKSLLNFKPSEKKHLSIKYGDDIIVEYSKIFKPDFMGNYFIGLGSDHLYIVSMAQQNSVKVADSKGNSIFEKPLGLGETAEVNIEKNSVFTIKSDKPIIAELSSLRPDFVDNSSDDISSVYGSYFILYVPKEIFVSAYRDTHVKVSDLKENVVFDGDLPERGIYSNLSLKPDFYIIDANFPVTVQFGYSDDNIYEICYGALNAFKGVSFGDIIYSSLYSDTVVTFKTKDKIFDPENLKSPGDYSINEVIKDFNKSITEYPPVYIRFSKPVLIYSNSNSGNVGGEQIPSLDGSGETFVFRTGKIYNFNNINHERKVIIIAKEDKTNVKINGENLMLNSLQPYYLSFKESFSLVNIESDKPLSVFEAGANTDLEFLSVLLPIEDDFSLSPITVLKGTGNESSQPQLPALWDKIRGVLGKMWQGIISIKFYDGLKSFWHKIIALLVPISRGIQPYLSKYFPFLTVQLLSVIIFYVILFIVLLVLFLIFKPRKRRNIVPKVPIEEIKNKPVSFSVETIEEKESVPFEEIKPQIIKLSETEKQAPIKTEKELGIIKEKEAQKPEEVIITEKQFGRKFTRFKPKEEKVEKTKEKLKKVSLPEEPSKVYGQEEEALKVTEEKTEEKIKEVSTEKEKKAIKEEKITEPVEEIVEQIPSKGGGAGETEEPSSSIEILLSKLKKEEKPEEKIEQFPKAPPSMPVEAKPALKKTFEHGFVSDAESINRIFEILANDENTKKLIIGKVFISATGREKVSFEINNQYRLGIIALTPIELRIAEDISKRINAKTSTGEAILIARKIRALEIVVSDTPEIKNYQGISINRIEDIIN